MALSDICCDKYFVIATLCDLLSRKFL